MNSHVSIYKKIQLLIVTGKKNPVFSKFIISLYVTSFKSKKNSNIDLFNELLILIINNSSIIKNLKFDVFKYDSAEKLDDAIQLLIKRHNARNMIKSITSNKYKHLITQRSIKLFVELMQYDINKSDLQFLLGEKLAAYKNSSMFCDSIKKIINNYSDFSLLSTINQIKTNNLNADIVYSSVEHNYIILKINDYEASKALGSHHWCISYSEHYFNQYVNCKDQRLAPLNGYIKNEINQYFIFDFNKTNNKSMIGVTFHGENPTYSHLKDDSVCHRTFFDANFSELYDINKKIINKDVDMLKLQRKIESIKDHEYYLHYIEKFFLSSYKGSDYISNHLLNTFKSKQHVNQNLFYELIATAALFNTFDTSIDSSVLFSFIDNLSIERNKKMRICAIALDDIEIFFKHIEYLSNKEVLFTKNVNLWISIIDQLYEEGIWKRTLTNFHVFKKMILKFFPEYSDFPPLDLIIKKLDDKINQIEPDDS